MSGEKGSRHDLLLNCQKRLNYIIYLIIEDYIFKL